MDGQEAETTVQEPSYFNRHSHSCHWSPTHCAPFHQLFTCVISVWGWCYWPHFIYESTRPRGIKHTGFLERVELELVCPPSHTALRMAVSQAWKNCILGCWRNLPMYHRDIIKKSLSTDGKMPKTWRDGNGQIQETLDLRVWSYYLAKFSNSSFHTNWLCNLGQMT